MVAVSQTDDSYYPATCAIVGTTRYVSGSLGDLQANDGAYMTFQSGSSQVSPRSLYAHQETTTIAGTDYFVSSPNMADMTGTNLSAPLSSTGRRTLGEFIYPLTGVKSIPSSTWVVYYRTWLSNLTEDVSVGSPSLVQHAWWNNAEYAYSSDDPYANSSTAVKQEYGGYGFNLPPTANITKVEVGYEAYTLGDEKIGVALSVDGGIGWTAEYISPSLGTTDQDIVSWIDFAMAANWTASMFSDSNFRSRVTVIRVGLQADDVLLDWLPVRVTFVGNPPSAHADVNVCIRRSDGAIRQMSASNVANSESLSAAVQTLSAAYDWPSYTVVDETDYLEIDYCVDISSASPEAIACFRIDDATSVTADQTRVANIMLPSEYAVEVELSGSSDTHDWAKIVWTVDSSWTTDDVFVTLQLYDCLRGTYPTTGNGYTAFQSSSFPSVDETKTQAVTTNMTDFRDYSGNWKMRIRGVKPVASPFSLKLDFNVYQVTRVKGQPVASFTHVPESPVIEETVTFNASLSVSEGSLITGYEWDFGDGNITTTSLFTITHTYANAGNYTVVLNVTNNDGLWGITSETIGIGSRARDESYSPPWNRTWALLSVPFMILVFAGTWLKKRKNKSKSVGIEFLNEITDGGIPDSFSVMVVGGSDSGKNVLFQELAHVFLKLEKPCVYVVYECFPDEIRENMKKFQWNTSTFERQGKFSFIDCFSSTAKAQSKEKYFLSQPFSLVDLGITVSKATNEAGNGVSVFLDSVVPLLTQLDSGRVVDFLQDRIARVKGVKGNFIFTLNRKSIDPALMSRLEETVDCIIELDANEVKGEVVRRLRIKKMRGRNPSDKWIQFGINPERGIIFLT